MRNKLKSAASLLSFFSFFLLSSTATNDLSAEIRKSRFPNTRGGRDSSAKSDRGIAEALSFRPPKEYTRTLSSSTTVHGHIEDDYNAVGNKECSLKAEELQRMKSGDESEWLIDDTSLEVLGNDPQQLINCTESGHRVVFKLSGVHKFKKTLTVDHELEFVSKSQLVNDDYTNARQVANFTCPDKGPFLRIKSRGFSATGFVVRSCTESAGEGTIIIQSNSRAAFDNSIFRGNQKRAIFVASHANLTLKNCYFENNGNQNILGGAIYAQNSIFLSIHNSDFHGNIAKSGGALHVLNDAMVVIVSSIFSRNKAFQCGGSVVMWGFNNVVIMNTTLSGNNASYGGGGIQASNRNNLTIINTTLSGNNASYGGGIGADYGNNLLLTNTTLSDNNAQRDGGGIMTEDNNDLKIINTTLSRNTALYGGACWLRNNNHLTIMSSNLSGNVAQESGGAILIIEKNNLVLTNMYVSGNHASIGGALCLQNGNHLTITNSTLLENTAQDKGGAIYVKFEAFLQIRESKIISNSAFAGGGIALDFNSRIIGYGCIFESNRADRGGGVHIESETKPAIAAQFIKSTFLNNNASGYGGGMVFKAFGSRSYNCSTIDEPCSRVLLIDTSFLGNHARFSGPAISTTRLGNFLVACENLYRSDDYSRFLQVKDIQYEQTTSKIKLLNKSPSPCQSWKGNHLKHGPPHQAVGVFGETINITINSANGPWISGSSETGFTLYNVSTTNQFPTLTISSIDAFKNPLAPILLEENALVLHSLSLSLSLSKILKEPVALSFEGESRNISSMFSNVPKGNYTIRIDTREDDILKSTNLTVYILQCGIDEEFMNDTNSCRNCGETSYNINVSSLAKCVPCPKHANCTSRYIKPNAGFWHKSPCHINMKRCIVKRVCTFQDKIEKLDNYAQYFRECSMNTIRNTTLITTYSNIQCRKGYEGPLCGICMKSYGLSSSFQCKKCGPIITSIFTLIASTCYLLFGTSITIKGVLPLRSTQQTNEDAEAPLLDDVAPTLEAPSSIQASEIVEENNESSQIQTLPNTTAPPHATEQHKHEIEIAKQNAIEAWKILVNFLQVSTTCASLDVDWTSEALDALNTFQVFGAGTISSSSRLTDCMLSFASRATRVIWRTLFSVFLPTIAIAIFAVYWGYRAIMIHEGDGLYFAKRLLLTIVTTTYITYFDLTQVAMRVFNCVVVYDDLEPLSNFFTRRWIADTSIECYKGPHIVLIGIAIAVFVLVMIAFPLFCFLGIARRNELSIINRWEHGTLRFLCGSFRARLAYWECLTLIKKVMLSIIIVFFYSLENNAQGVLVLIVLVFFLYLHLICRPYNEDFSTLNYYEGGSLLTSCVVYTFVQFLNAETISESGRHTVSFFLIIIMCCFVSVMIYKMLSNIIHLLSIILESKSVQVPDNASWISTLKLYYKNRMTRHST